jgi:DNA-binding phage protein
MTLTAKPWDAADYLTDHAMIEGYLAEAGSTGDPAVIALAQQAALRAGRRIGREAIASMAKESQLLKRLSGPKRTRQTGLRRLP